MPADALKCKECSTTYPLDARYVCERCFGPLEVAYRPPGGTPDELKRIAARVSARQSEGCDVFVYFKHEDTPQGALHAEQLLVAR